MPRVAPLRLAAGLLAMGVAAGCGSGAPATPVPRPAAGRVLDADVQSSIRSALSAVEADVRSAPAWQHLGCVYDANQLDDLAGACYRSAIALDPREPRSTYLLGCLCVDESQAQPAIACFEAVQRAQPDYAPAWWRCGAVRLDLGDASRALTDFDQALQLDPSAVRVAVSKAECLLALRRESEVERLLARIKSENPQASSAVDRVLGNALRRLGREAEALPLLERNQSEAPVPPDPWFELVGAEIRGLASVRTMAAQLLGQSRTAQALQLLERARAGHPDDVRILRLLGRALLASSRAQEAVAVLQRAATQARMGDLERAYETIQAAARLDPGLAKCPAVEADLLMRRGQYAEARSAFQRAIQADPRNAAMHVGLALSCASLGQHEPGMRAARRALQLDPQSVPALAALAYSCLEQGAKEEARVWLARARALNATDPMVQQLTQRLAGAEPPR
jgi:tetratricopeptide (TPR) repeat protein